MASFLFGCHDMFQIVAPHFFLDFIPLFSFLSIPARVDNGNGVM